MTSLIAKAVKKICFSHNYSLSCSQRRSLNRDRFFSHAKRLQSRLTEFSLLVVYFVLTFYSPTQTVCGTFLKWNVRVHAFLRLHCCSCILFTLLVVNLAYLSICFSYTDVVVGLRITSSMFVFVQLLFIVLMLSDTSGKNSYCSLSALSCIFIVLYKQSNERSLSGKLVFTLSCGLYCIAFLSICFSHTDVVVGLLITNAMYVLVQLLLIVLNVKRYYTVFIFVIIC